MKRVCCLFAVLFLVGFFSSCGVSGDEENFLGRTVSYEGISKTQEKGHYWMHNQDDIYVSYFVYQNDTEEVTVDSDGRLKGGRDLTVGVLDEVTDPKTEEEVTEIVEAYMAEKLPEERCKVSDISLTDFGYSVTIHSENSEISNIYAMVNEDGRLRSFVIHYDDTISVTEEEEAYVKELVEQDIEKRYPDRKDCKYRVRYRMIEKQKVAEAIITVVDADGCYVPYDLMIGFD